MEKRKQRFGNGIPSPQVHPVRGRIYLKKRAGEGVDHMVTSTYLGSRVIVVGDHDLGVLVVDQGYEKALFLTTNALVSGHAVRQLLQGEHQDIMLGSDAK